MKTPIDIAKILFFLLKPSSHDRRQPVQAPVPGRGIATKSTNAKKPSVSYLFSNLSTFF